MVICSKQITFDVKYKSKNDIKIENINKNKLYFNNLKKFIDHIVEFIKMNVIKKFPKLNLIDIFISIHDHNNILHQIFVSINNLLLTLINYHEKINYNKIIYIYVKYDNKIVWFSNIDFTLLLHLKS
jgi:hypothetical protein